jgi:hypothetical protein
LRRANAALARECEGKQGNEQEHQSDRGRNDREGERHAFIVNCEENRSRSRGCDRGATDYNRAEVRRCKTGG